MEVERVSTVRKRALTHYRFCRDCGTFADFLPPATAAELFEVEPAVIAACLAESEIHLSRHGELCLCSLLRRRQGLSGNS